MDLEYLNLNAFLDFGYFLKYSNSKELFDFSLIDKKKYDSADDQELIRIGSHLWGNAISSVFEQGKDNCVPLSGGLDSRAILAGLLQCMDASNIYTYTYGIPGAWDYEIGRNIAKMLGTKHTQINMDNYQYKQSELLEISCRVDMQTMLFLHPPLYVTNQFSDMNIWSGVGVDALFGLHMLGGSSTSFEQAAIRSYKRDVYVTSCKLSRLAAADYVPYIDGNTVNAEGLSFDHIIDLMNRQPKYIWPHVCMKGFKFISLLKCRDLVSFALSVDQDNHIHQRLYKNIILNKYPDLFKYPTKSNLGLPLDCPKAIVDVKKKYIYLLRKIGIRKRNINYTDFNRSIRDNESLRNLIEANITSLASRKIITWIDILKIFNDHMKRRGNYADALLVLASLEIHLKNGKIL